MERVSIPRRVRFEVFKRDSFTCQYCGAKAPEAVLVIDHVHPVAGGGDNDPMNLLTACGTCNSGKGDRTLDDNSVLARQRVQMEELNQRRVQIEMMLEWRDELLSLDVLKTDKIVAAIEEHSGLSLTESGRQEVKKWVHRYDFAELMDAVDTAFIQYRAQYETAEDVFDRAFPAIPGIIRIRGQSDEKPYLRDLFYIRGILRKRFGKDDNRGYLIRLLERCAEADVDIEGLTVVAKRISSWGAFERALVDYLNEYEKKH